MKKRQRYSKAVALIAATLLCSSFNMTLVRQRTLPELILYSDHIFTGQIKRVTDTSLTFVTTEVVKGHRVDSFSIYKKQNAPGLNTNRLVTNVAGQTELLFLSYNDEDKTFQLSTGHGEAECLIDNDSVFVYGKYWYIKKHRERYPERSVSAAGTIINATCYKKNEMLYAIKDYDKDARRLVKQIQNEPDVHYSLHNKIPAKEEAVLKNKQLIEFSNRSAAHRRLMDESLDEPQHIYLWR